jgi:hypothetical protein
MPSIPRWRPRHNALKKLPSHSRRFGRATSAVSGESGDIPHRPYTSADYLVLWRRFDALDVKERFCRIVLLGDADPL